MFRYISLLIFVAFSLVSSLAMENDNKRKFKKEEDDSSVGYNLLKKTKFEETPKAIPKSIEIFSKKPIAMMKLAYNFCMEKGKIDNQNKRLTYSEKDHFYFKNFQNYFIEYGSIIKIPEDFFETYLKKIYEPRPFSLLVPLLSTLPVPLKIKILCLTTWSEEDFAETFDIPFWVKPRTTRFLDQPMVKNIPVQETLDYDSPLFFSTLSNLKKKYDGLHRLELMIKVEGLSPNAKDVIEALLENDVPLYALKLIWLHDVDIDNEGANAISFMLHITSTLGRLDLGDNNLTEEGMLNIIESLKFNTTLNHINFSAYDDKEECDDDSLSSHCVNGLKDLFLIQNKSLTSIILSHKLIDEYGANIVAQIIKENRSLRRLCLSHNSLPCESVKNIAQALTNNETLQYLDMSYCHICHEGIKALTEALKKNRTLIEIKLSGNEISLEDKNALDEVCKLKAYRRVIMEINGSF